MPTSRKEPLFQIGDAVGACEQRSGRHVIDDVGRALLEVEEGRTCLGSAETNMLRGWAVGSGNEHAGQAANYLPLLLYIHTHIHWSTP